MAAVLTIIVILLSLLNEVSTSKARQSGINTDGISKRRSKVCSRNTDCMKGEYCHLFHRLCLKSRQTINAAPVRTSVKKCSRNSNCKTREFCHNMWKICLPFQKTFKTSPTHRPSWYCSNSKDCRIDQECHKTFHACFTRPHVPAVRRSTVDSRKCDTQSDCGPKYYCHEHFKMCLSKTITTTGKPLTRVSKVKRCQSSRDCRKGMSCHKVWKICFTLAKAFVRRQNRTRRCEIDRDCKDDEFCHIMAGKRRAVIARHRRNVLSVCLPRRLKQSRRPVENPRCKTDADCGPNKCCLDKLGVCLDYPLPGEMCLLKKTNFVCPCASRAFCKPRGKSASLKRIINKMKLPQSVANHVLTSSRKRKHRIGKCIPGY